MCWTCLGHDLAKFGQIEQGIACGDFTAHLQAVGNRSHLQALKKVVAVAIDDYITKRTWAHGDYPIKHITTQRQQAKAYLQAVHAKARTTVSLTNHGEMVDPKQVLNIIIFHPWAKILH